MESHPNFKTMDDPARWLSGAVAGSPGSPALVADEGLISYRQLEHYSHFIGTVLGKRNIRSGMTLAISGTSGLLLPLLVQVAPSMGITVFPLSSALSANEFRRLLIEGGVNGLVSACPPADLPAGVRWLDPKGLQPSSGAFANRQARGNPLKIHDIHAIVATSGTLSGPKGVMLSGKNLSAAVRASQDRLPLHRGDRWLICLPLYHMGGLSILYRCAAAGATALVHDEFDPLRIWDDLMTSGVTHISLVPAMLSRLLDSADGRRCPSACRVVLVGGGILHPDLAFRALDAGWPLCVTYGLTETASQCATDCGPAADRQEGNVGRPLAGIEIGIEQPDDQGLGRIRIRGPTVMAGYANPRKIRGIGLTEGWFLTSDLGQMDANGRLRVIGRADDVLVTGGEKVHPEAVEAALRRYPGVFDVAVGARGDSVWGDRIVAFIVGDPDLAELAAWARTRLRGASRPREYFSVPVLPRNAMGKLDRSAVRRMAEDITGKNPYPGR